jgi:hypothetical protein
MANLILNGSTSGSVTLSSPAVSGTTTLTLPTTSGTVITTASTDTVNSLNAGIGVNQTWTDVTASRASGTTYTNSTGKPIMVSIQMGQVGVSQNTQFLIGGTAINDGNGGMGIQGIGSTWWAAIHIVPNGVTYSLTAGTNSILKWWELR